MLDGHLPCSDVHVRITLSCPALPCPVALLPCCTGLPRYSMSGIYSAALHACLHPGDRQGQAPAADCAEAASVPAVMYVDYMLKNFGWQGR